MRIRHLLFWILLVGAISGAEAQMFQNRNLYDVWITAESYLNSGKFDHAISLYEGVPNIPQFQKRLNDARSLQSLFSNAERLYRQKKYDQALEVYSKYRDVDHELHVAVFDNRIQACLRQLDKIVVRKLNESTRVVAGFEWAHKGAQQLAMLDTTAAEKSYTKAEKLGGNLNATLREQYKEGRLAVESLKAWGKEYRRAISTKNKDAILDLLKKYRLASRYIIDTLEYEIKTREEGYAIPALANSDPAQQMKIYAQNCRMEELLYHLKNHPRTIFEIEKATTLLADYIRIEEDITQLKKDPGNRTFLESAYQSLISKGSQIPQLNLLIEQCARKSYYDYLINLALVNEKAGDDTGERRKYEEALQFVVKARQIGLAEYQADLDAMQGRLAGKTGCEEIVRQFVRAVISVRREISNCRIQQSKKIWDEALARLKGCNLDATAFLTEYTSLRDSVRQLYEADSLYFVLDGRASRALAANHCEEAAHYYWEMATLPLCNSSFRDSAMTYNQQRLVECQRLVCYTSNREKAIAGISSKEWKQAYVHYEAAYECALPGQKEKISQILATIECDAYPERCRKNMVSVEPTFRILANKPNYTEEGVKRPTAYGYFTSAGLQVSFLSAASPFDLLIGVEYFRTQYESLRVTNGVNHKASEFDISGAEASVGLKVHKPRTDPDRLRPYIKIGAELLLPLVYAQVNYEDIYKSTNDRSLIKKQALMANGALGIEVERKRFGFFAEAVAAYNFSGIYNANAVSSSGARSMTEAHFKAIGVRLGIRFW